MFLNAYDCGFCVIARLRDFEQDPKNINNQLRLIKDMQKRLRSAQEVERETQDVVRQEDLHVEKGVRVPVLPVCGHFGPLLLCYCVVVKLYLDLQSVVVVFVS